MTTAPALRPCPFCGGVAKSFEGAAITEAIQALIDAGDYFSARADKDSSND